MSTKPETEIKKLVTEANLLISRPTFATQVKAERLASVNTVTVTIPSGYGDIVVWMVANSPYSRSHYTVKHPALGEWGGMLNSVTHRDNEYGHKPGMPRRIS